jgi:hypothetical protein
MIKSEPNDGIVWLTVEGDLDSQDAIREIGRWLSQGEAFSGFITDLRSMTSIPSSEKQKKLEEWRKGNKTGKPHALLGQTNALGVLIQIYARLTKAEDTRYFMDPERAIAWVNGFDRRQGDG